ncbi:hypothetical protein ACFPJ4_04875 [Lysinimonas soli]|uniref:Uncharacterized protein n=1 Tax=Lysinimonas soli TaxID=1074233 RepID=A0ABW0NNN6_9MICO
MSDAASPLPDETAAPRLGSVFWADPPRSKRLGRVAMIVAILVFVISMTLAITLGTAAGPYSVRDAAGFRFQFNVGDPNPTINALAIAMLLHVLLGTGLGLWALIQGIVATAANRGRRAGIAAIVVAGTAPVVSLIAFFVAMSANLPPA